MRRLRMPVIVLLALAGSAGAASFALEDKVVGAIWEWFAKDPTTEKWERRGLFRCTTDGKVLADGKVVGTHKTSAANVEIKITVAKVEANKGTFRGTRVAKDGTSWEGTYTKKDGTEIPVRMRMVAD